jgi:hypothetical protein
MIMTTQFTMAKKFVGPQEEEERGKRLFLQ